MSNRKPNRKATVTRDTTEEPPVLPASPFVFISHDARDHEVAEAFSKLLSGVSLGLLRSFRSSGAESRYGLQYGIEWFPEITTNLQKATDVICLLTERSLNRPWILFEAGFARGHNEATQIMGLALGIPLEKVNSGPFALFHNCDDDVESIVDLVMQLLKRLPGAEPDKEAVRLGVESFRQKVTEIFVTGLTTASESEKAPPDSGRLFEEIKAMFYDVSSSVKPRVAELPQVESLIRQASGKPFDPIGIPILASFLPASFHWLQQMAMETYRRLESKTLEKGELQRLKYLVDISLPTLSADQTRNSIFPIIRYFSDYILFVANATKGPGNASAGGA